MTAHPRASMRPTAALAALSLTFVASGCSLLGSGGDDEAQGEKLVVLSHESFNPDKALVKEFEEASGYDVSIRRVGDAGALATDIALNADKPRGDVVFGVDNTFASRVVDAGALAVYEGEQPAGAQKYRLDGDDTGLLAPVDVSNVCINVDTAWFAAEGITPPKTLDDLTQKTYRDLTVLPAASTSSPGMAFLLTTVAAKGDGWQTYWGQLLGNGAKVVDGWSDAYYTDFTAASEKGKRPIVLSYDSSPAFILDDDGKPTTAALLDTCFEQVEYAAVLNGAKNASGAAAFVKFLQGKDLQASLPESMYVFPVSNEVDLPSDWAEHAVRPEKPWHVAPEQIDAQREDLLRTWTDLVTR